MRLLAHGRGRWKRVPGSEPFADRCLGITPRELPKALGAQAQGRARTARTGHGLHGSKMTLHQLAVKPGLVFPWLAALAVGRMREQLAELSGREVRDLFLMSLAPYLQPIARETDLILSGTSLAHHAVSAMHEALDLFLRWHQTILVNGSSHHPSGARTFLS